MDIFDTAAAFYNALPPRLRGAIFQKLVELSVDAFVDNLSAAQKRNKQEVLYEWYLERCVKHFSNIEAHDQRVPFTGSLGMDRFLLWPELDEENHRRAAKPRHAEQEREPPLPRKIKATELLTLPLNNNRLFAVQGAAGVGKTTMAQALARYAAKQALELKEHNDEGGPQIQYLPLYFNAKDLIKLAADTPVGQVSASGEDVLRDLLDAVLQKPDRALLVIVDDLDEVEGRIRTEALKALRNLWLPGGNHRYLLLGRPGSISNVPWVQEDEEVLKLAMKPWGEEEVREYLGRWTAKGGRAHLEPDELDQVMQYMRSLVGLPSPALLVQMVVASFVERKQHDPENPLAQMPTTRIGLYRNYLRLLLELREGDKALQGTTSTAHPADQKRREWLGCLELLLKLSPEQREMARRARCSADFLLDVTTAHARGRPCSELLHEDADFAKWWEDRKLCRLGHESLHELLAAEALARLYRDDPKGFWKGWLHPNIFDPYWQQTLIFAIALMSKGDQTSLMNGLLKLGSCDPISKWTKRHLEVMAKAWGAGASYSEDLWQSWLGHIRDPELLLIAASNPALRPHAIDALEKLAREAEGEWVRYHAAEALGELEPKKAISALEKLAREAEGEWVRYHAAKALGELGPEAISALEKLAREAEDERVRSLAAEALGELGPEAISALEKLAREAEDERVRYRAAEALGGLGAPPLGCETLD